MLGVFLNRDTLAPEDLDFSPLDAALPRWRYHAATARHQLVERLHNAQVVVANKVMLDRAILEGAAALRLVCVTATGTNNIDLQAAEARGIAVCNVRGYSTPSVSQHVFALILALSTRLPDYRAAVREGQWQRAERFCLLDYPIRELAGKALGIIGYGDLGQAVARLARAFDMQVWVAESVRREDGKAQSAYAAEARDGMAVERLPLRELLPRVDVLTLHCPLVRETRGLIGASELALMRPDAVLINTARGGIVDEAALAEALREGRLGGAGVDVLSTEPPTAGNPLLAADIPHLIVTPHVAWGSKESRQRVVEEVAHNIRAFITGTPRNVVAV